MQVLNTGCALKNDSRSVLTDASLFPSRVSQRWQRGVALVYKK